MLQREAGIETGYTRSMAARIRPMYLRARGRGYSRGYGWHAEVRKILVIQIVSVCYSTPAGGASHQNTTLRPRARCDARQSITRAAA